MSPARIEVAATEAILQGSHKHLCKYSGNAAPESCCPERSEIAMSLTPAKKSIIAWVRANGLGRRAFVTGILGTIGLAGAVATAVAAGAVPPPSGPSSAVHPSTVPAQALMATDWRALAPANEKVRRWQLYESRIRHDAIPTVAPMRDAGSLVPLGSSSSDGSVLGVPGQRSTTSTSNVMPASTGGAKSMPS